LCGKLEHVKQIPVKGRSDTFTEKTKALRGIALRVYERPNEVPCCDGLKVIAQTTTGLWGQFMLKGFLPGPYWLVAEVKDRRFVMPIRYQPAKDSESPCSDQLFRIDDAGGFWTGMIIVVE
jgi:hypothetical protein